MPIQYGLMWKHNLTRTQKKKTLKTKKKTAWNFMGQGYQTLVTT